MCGRFCLYSDPLSIREHFVLQNSMVLTPRYNIAPTQVIPVIRTPGQLDFITWGLRPKWLKAEQNGFINARMETLQEKPAFKQAFKLRRCLIVANGYYEWKQLANVKQPYLISKPRHELFAMAGIWEADTCAIITSSAQSVLSSIHERMPLIIEPKHYALWLNANSSVADLQQCLHVCDQPLIAQPVSTKVNNPKHDFAECTQALH